MKLSECIKLFLNEQRPTTRRSYFYVLRDMQNYLGPARPVENLKPTDLVEYMQDVRSRGYAVATVNKYVKTLRTMFNWLVAIEIIDHSPVTSAIKTKKLPAYIDRSKAISEAELNRLLEWLRWNNKPRDYALILFLADTGCRARGAAELTEDRLELDNLRAYVIEKGEKKRTVVYGRETATAIRYWLLMRPREAGKYVFSRKANPMTTNYLSQIIRRNCERAGIKRPISAHAFRHRKGHQLADEKVAPSIAATALGHSDPTITLQHYYPADWESAEKELRKLVQPDNGNRVIPINEIKNKRGG